MNAVSYYWYQFTEGAKLALILILACAGIWLAIMAFAAPVAYAECKVFSKTTGYWTKYSLSGCYVLIDNQYLLEKDNLRAGDKPAFDPKYVEVK